MHRKYGLYKPPGWPRYMLAKKLSDGTIAYYWNPPTKFRKRGCLIGSEPLGKDYALAKERCDKMLNPHIDEWRNGKSSLNSIYGTLNWLTSEYCKTKKFQKLEPRTQRDYVQGFELISSYKLKKDPLGRRFGAIEINKITPAIADRIYEALVETPDGRKRYTTVNKSIRAIRRAWNVTYRRHPDIVPSLNPWARMGLENNSSKTTAAKT